MKSDGHLARCSLKGTFGDATFAVLCGCGHNIRKILAHLKALLLALLASLIQALDRPEHDQVTAAGLDQLSFVLCLSTGFHADCVYAACGGVATQALPRALKPTTRPLRSSKVVSHPRVSTSG